MPSELEHVAQELLATIEQLPSLVAALQRLVQRCREQAAYIGQMHSSNPAARAAALQLDAAAQACEKAAHHAAQVPLKATAWVQQMVSGARTIDLTPIGHEAPVPIAAPTTAPSRARSTAPVTSSARNTDELAAWRLKELPKRQPNDRTSGIWLTKRSDSLRLVSGHDEHYETARKLIQEKKLGPPPHNLAIASHVEVKFAILMRERGLNNESIVINNLPCTFPYGCQRFLADILPPGARLTVYAPGYKNTFIGKESQT